MNPELKKLLNSLNCPICKAPVDIMSNSNKTGYDYCCAANSNHYMILVKKDPIFLERERVFLYDKTNCYSIINFHSETRSVTTIQIFKIDLEGRIIFEFKEKSILLDTCAFDFRNFNLNKAIHRIKTVFVFN